MPSLTLPGPGALYNTNELLGTEGISGLKTGNLGDGSHSLLYTASLDVGMGAPLSVTGVVLGGFSDDSVNSAILAMLFASIRSGFHTVPIVSSGRDVGSVATPWGSTARVVVADSASILTWSDTPITATMETVDSDEFQGRRGGREASRGLRGPNSVSVPVVIEGSIVQPTAWWRLTHPSQLWRRVAGAVSAPTSPGAGRGPWRPRGARAPSAGRSPGAPSASRSGRGRPARAPSAAGGRRRDPGEQAQRRGIRLEQLQEEGLEPRLAQAPERQEPHQPVEPKVIRGELRGHAPQVARLALELVLVPVLGEGVGIHRSLDDDLDALLRHRAERPVGVASCQRLKLAFIS